MYFDCLLDYDLKPVSGAPREPHELRSYLLQAEMTENYSVCIGQTLEFLTVQEYLERGQDA